MKQIHLMRAIVAFMAVFFVMTIFASSADAIPAWARKHNVTCSACHSAFPLLNATGRAFKENGYKFSREEEAESIISDFMHLDKNFPISAIIVARPFDKKEGGDRKIRAIHEIEILVGGTIYKNISGFFELEAEDEDDFEARMNGWITWHASEFFNLQFAYDRFFVGDPYDPLSSSRRLTRGRNSVIDQKFGGADNNGRIRDPRQVIGFYGRVFDGRVFYSATYSGVAKDAEGVNASNFNGRLAFDVVRDKVMLGAFYIGGECKIGASNCGVNRDFTRWGFDGQVDLENVIIHGAYVKTKDDLNFLDNGSPPEVENSAWYVEGIYIFRREGRPFIVPLVRLDRFKKNNGMDGFTTLTMNVSFYAVENVKIYAEWFKEISVPFGYTKGGRFTIQAIAGF